MADTKKIMADVERAFTDAVRRAGVSATLRRGFGQRIDAHAVGQQILADTVSSYIQSEVRRELCSRGYAASLTCRQNSNSSVDYILQVDREQIVVGVSISF